MCSKSSRSRARKKPMLTPQKYGNPLKSTTNWFAITSTTTAPMPDWKKTVTFIVAVDFSTHSGRAWCKIKNKSSSLGRRFQPVHPRPARAQDRGVPYPLRAPHRVRQRRGAKSAARTDVAVLPATRIASRLQVYGALHQRIRARLEVSRAFCTRIYFTAFQNFRQGRSFRLPRIASPCRSDIERCARYQRSDLLKKIMHHLLSGGVELFVIGETGEH